MSAGTPHLVRPPAQGTAEVFSTRRLLNIPNFLTLFRIILVPFFVVFVSKHRFTYGLYIFAIAALTDSLDGTVARWFTSSPDTGRRPRRQRNRASRIRARSSSKACFARHRGD